MPEEMFTLVNGENQPVYTMTGMDGHFAVCSCLGDMMTFTHKVGYSQMMDMVRRTQGAVAPRFPVYPAKVTLTLERVLSE